MMKFRVSFEMPVRPGFPLNSQFSSSRHPILMKRAFRVSACGMGGKGLHSAPCTSPTRKLKHGEAGGAISGSLQETVMGVANA